MLLQIGGKNGWCGVCLKDASQWSYGYCPPGGKPPPDRSLITRVKRAKNWGFCSDQCRIDSRLNTLKETQLTVLTAKDCAGFNTSVLSYRQDGELCAGNKIQYPMMKVYTRKKLRWPNDGRKYTFKLTDYKINTVNTSVSQVIEFLLGRGGQN